MKNLKLFSLLFVIILAFASCKKDDASSTSLSKSDLIARTWQVQKLAGKALGFDITIYEKGKSGNAQDFSKFRMTFQKDGKYTGTDDEGKAVSGVWKFIDTESKITLDAGTATEATFTINNLTAANFDFSQKTVDQGTETTVTFYMIPA